MEKPALLRMLTGMGFVTSSENISTGGCHSVVRKSSEVAVLDVYYDLYPVKFLIMSIFQNFMNLSKSHTYEFQLPFLLKAFKTYTR